MNTLAEARVQFQDSDKGGHIELELQLPTHRHFMDLLVEKLVPFGVHVQQLNVKRTSGSLLHRIWLSYGQGASGEISQRLLVQGALFAFLGEVFV